MKLSGYFGLLIQSNAHIQQCFILYKKFFTKVELTCLFRFKHFVSDDMTDSGELLQVLQTLLSFKLSTFIIIASVSRRSFKIPGRCFVA